MHQNGLLEIENMLEEKKMIKPLTLTHSSTMPLSRFIQYNRNTCTNERVSVGRRAPAM